MLIPSPCFSAPQLPLFCSPIYLSLSWTLSLLSYRALSYFPVDLAVTCDPRNVLSISVPSSNLNTSSAPWLGGMWFCCVLTPASTRI